MKIEPQGTDLCSSLFLRRCEEPALSHNDATLCAHDQFAEGVLNTQKPRRGFGAVVDDVEPVAVAQVAGADVFVLGQFNIADAGAAFDFDRQLLIAWTMRPEIKAGPRFQAS